MRMSMGVRVAATVSCEYEVATGLGWLRECYYTSGVMPTRTEAMSQLRCVCRSTCSVSDEMVANCHAPQLSTYFLSETSPNRTCTSTQVAVADVAPTSAPRHAARVHTWLKAATEWVGGWLEMRMSV